MRVPLRTFLLAVLLLASPTVWAGEAELLLSGDFRPNSAESMPHANPPSGMRFDRHEYPEWNAVEWQVRMQGPTGQTTRSTGLDSADFVVQFPTAEPLVLHWSKGSHANISDFQPRMESLAPGTPLTLESFGGRSSDGVMPYFNLAGTAGGLVVAVGWPGDWRANFELLTAGRVRVTAGLKHSKLELPAGEILRVPSVLVMSYRGDWVDGQNQFRRLMLQHFTPRTASPMQLMPVAASVHGMIGFNDTTEANLKSLALDIAEEGLPVDVFWLDAGWNEGGFPQGQGNPNAAPARFPRGLRPVGNSAHQAGMRFLVWFEPERAMRGTWLHREHPDWLLTASGTPDELRYLEKDGFHLLDLGNPQARAWAVETVSETIADAEVDIYRQDFNAYPAYFWRTAEQPDEAALREVRYINGLYDFLDELARRHPRLIIDNCASGGRRLDFEMMRRSVVLWRSDSCWDDPSFPRNVQAMMHGLSHWLPLHGLGALTTDDVALRSGMGACASFPINFRDPGAVATLRSHLARYLKIRPLFATDFYPLTEWSDDPERWLAYQFHDPRTGEGIAQAFRGPAATEPACILKLRGLDSSKRYRVENWDAPSVTVVRSGEELMQLGVTLDGPGARAVVLHYAPEP